MNRTKNYTIVLSIIFMVNCVNKNADINDGAKTNAGQPTRANNNDSPTNTGYPIKTNDKDSSDALLPAKCRENANEEDCTKTTIVFGKCEWIAGRCLDKYRAASIEEYLSKFSVGAKVLALAQKGTQNYQKLPLSQLRAHAKNSNATGGGRGADWIKDTFQKSEAEIISDLKDEGELSTRDILTIDKAFDEAKKASPPDPSLPLPNFNLVKELSVNYLHDYRLGRDGAIVQLASQFNYLESVSTTKAPVLSYLHDDTQGPQGSIEAAAAALHRTAHEASGKLKHALHQVFTGDISAFYKNGYLEPHKLSDAQLQDLNLLAKANIKKMTLLPQWVQCEATGATQLQVFSAAPSYQGASTPALGSPGALLCEELVSAQYEAIAKIAVIRSILAGTDVPVHFTLVGQGAFNNPASVMALSLRKVASVLKGYGKVQVYIHGYASADQDKIRAAVDKTFFTLSELTKEEFMAR